jgi:DnaJ-class molecular chaperone
MDNKKIAKKYFNKYFKLHYYNEYDLEFKAFVKILNKKNKKTEPCNILPAIPYQLCPKCNGDKVVMIQHWYGSPTSISTGTSTCDVCNGSGIIPMYVIPIEHNTLSG